MYIFKKEYQGKIIFVRGYGNINTIKINPNDIFKMSKNENFKMLLKYIEKYAEPKKETTKKSK